jgi:hypothetical protein
MLEDGGFRQNNAQGILKQVPITEESLLYFTSNVDPFKLTRSNQF